MLDGDCVGYLMGVVLGAILEKSVGKFDGYKFGCLLGRILGTPCNRAVFVMYLPFVLEHWS